MRGLGWMALIMAPFALLAKSLSMFSKAIGTLLKPAPRRVHKRAPNYLLEDDIKRSRISLNKARQRKIRTEVTLSRAKEDKIRADIRLTNAKIKQMSEGEEGWEKELRKLGIDPADVEVIGHTSNKGINLDTMDNAELNAKDYMGCAACNFIDSTGKETKCHMCGKPLRPIHTGI